MMKLPEADPFLEPVDPVALCIPDYFDIIKEPMDLGTIRTKIETSFGKKPNSVAVVGNNNNSNNSNNNNCSSNSNSNEGITDDNNSPYNTIDDIAHDVRLVFSNARTYNPPGHGVHDYAAALGCVFERHLPNIASQDKANGSTPAAEYKWLQLEVRRALEEHVKKIREAKRAEEQQQQQHEYQQRLSLRRAADGILTSDQKRQLTEKISKQKGRELAKIVDVLKTYSVALRQSISLAQQNSEFVVEVDLERLPSYVLTLLWKLMYPNDTTFAPASPASPALASSPGLDPKKKKKQPQPPSSLQQCVELDQDSEFQDFTLEKEKNT